MDINVNAYFSDLGKWQSAFAHLFEGDRPVVSLVSKLTEKDQNLITLVCLYTLGNHVGSLRQVLKCDESADLKERVKHYGLGVWKSTISQFGFAQLVSTILDITSGKIECEYAPSPGQFLKHKQIQRPAYLDERPKRKLLECTNSVERDKILGYIGACAITHKVAEIKPKQFMQVMSGLGCSLPEGINPKEWPPQSEEKLTEVERTLIYDTLKTDLSYVQAFSDAQVQVFIKDQEEAQKYGRFKSRPRSIKDYMPKEFKF